MSIAYDSGAVPYTREAVQRIREWSKNNSDAFIAKGLGWDVPRLRRIAQKHGIALTEMKETAPKPVPAAILAAANASQPRIIDRSKRGGIIELPIKVREDTAQIVRAVASRLQMPLTRVCAAVLGEFLRQPVDTHYRIANLPRGTMRSHYIGASVTPQIRDAITPMAERRGLPATTFAAFVVEHYALSGEIDWFVLKSEPE